MQPNFEIFLIYSFKCIDIHLNKLFHGLANHNLLLQSVPFMSHIFSFTGQNIKARYKRRKQHNSSDIKFY